MLSDEMPRKGYDNNIVSHDFLCESYHNRI